MTDTIVRKEEKSQDITSVVLYKNLLAQKREYQDYLTSIAELFAKSPTDNFVILENPVTSVIMQGDILLFSNNTTEYKEYMKTFKELHEPVRNNNLQEGSAVTGNHEAVPIDGHKIKITNGTVTLKNIGNLKKVNYKVKLLESEHPFVLFHKEHGNITMPSGTYLCMPQLDAKTLRRVQD